MAKILKRVMNDKWGQRRLSVALSAISTMSRECRLRLQSRRELREAYAGVPQPAIIDRFAPESVCDVTANPFRFLSRVIARLRDIDLARTAGSLSFTTLLAIVPLVTVAFSFVARFPIFEDWLKVLEQFLLKHLLPFAAPPRFAVTSSASPSRRRA